MFSTFSIIDLAGKRPDKLEPVEIQLIKDFIIGASRNINEKILDLEKMYHVNVKLAPLPKKVVNVASSDPLMSFPMMTTAHVNTGLHGSFKYPTTVDINLPFLLDPISGTGGENYKQRLNKMLEYIKIYKIVQKQLGDYVAELGKIKATGADPTPEQIKIARAKVSSQYVEFLPDTDFDIDTIQEYENHTKSEDDIESEAKSLLNLKPTTSTPGKLDPKILAAEKDAAKQALVQKLYDDYVAYYNKTKLEAADINEINTVILPGLISNTYVLTTVAQKYLRNLYFNLVKIKGI